MRPTKNGLRTRGKESSLFGHTGSSLWPVLGRVFAFGLRARINGVEQADSSDRHVRGRRNFARSGLLPWRAIAAAGGEITSSGTSRRRRLASWIETSEGSSRGRAFYGRMGVLDIKRADDEHSAWSYG